MDMGIFRLTETGKTGSMLVSIFVTKTGEQNRHYNVACKMKRARKDT